MATKPRGNRYQRTWTKAKVLAAMKRWQEKMGQPPTGADWNPTRARFFALGNQKRADRWWNSVKEYETGKYPSYTTVQDLFEGKWNDAVREAGYVPLPSCKPTSEQRTKWLGRAQSEAANEAGLLFQWAEVERALKADNKAELRTALFDLAAVAATYADELCDEPKVLPTQDQGPIEDSSPPADN